MTNITTAVRGALGVIELDRPEALNALTHRMVTDMADALRAFAADDAVERVLITGAAQQAPASPHGEQVPAAKPRWQQPLCAGGDVVSLHADVQSTRGQGAARFWRDEYTLNAQIARFPKPVVAIQHGIVLGGGVGISGHASHRVVTDSTRIGFPEVTIGFVPDVGATWLLTRRRGELGTRAALTGDHFGAADAIALGLADSFVPAERLVDQAVVEHRDLPAHDGGHRRRLRPDRRRRRDGAAEGRRDPGLPPGRRLRPANQERGPGLRRQRVRPVADRGHHVARTDDFGICDGTALPDRTGDLQSHNLAL